MNTQILTSLNISDVWKNISEKKEIITFNDTSVLFNKYNSFSNNFVGNEGFNFIMPYWSGIYANNTIKIEFADKAINLCKASIMGDHKTFLKILDSKTPLLCKNFSLQINVIFML